MSVITKENIKKISRLARIEVQEVEIENLSNQIGGIIGWVKQLEEVNTEGVEPLSNVYDTPLRLNEDKIINGDGAEEILSNTKHGKYGYFAVPKVIE
jgi:aspartyl-tRNA(Asn)/glutamyl-tRNA(Gln) amidotransferase subunit C